MVESTRYVTLTENNFGEEVLKSSEPVLVDFWAEWCGPCRVIAPVIEELAAEFGGRAKVGKVDVDRHGSLASQYGIRSIPTLLLFKDGRIADRMVGAVSKKVLAGKLDALLQPV